MKKNQGNQTITQPGDVREPHVYRSTWRRLHRLLAPKLPVVGIGVVCLALTALFASGSNLSATLNSENQTGSESQVAQPYAGNEIGVGIELPLDRALTAEAQMMALITEAVPTLTPTPSATPTPSPYPEMTDAYGVIQEGMPVELFTPDETTAYIAFSEVNIRQLPSTDSDIISTLTQGDAVLRLGYGLHWSKIELADGQAGYVYTRLISERFVAKPTPTPTPTPRPTSTPVDPGEALTSEQKAAIVDLAKSCLGVRYVFGGATMNGFDCSGLILYIYDTLFDVSLPHKAREQAKLGRSVTVSEMQAGDVICYDWDNHDGVVDHVAIYIGNGQFIDASHSAGKVRQKAFNSGSPIVTIRRFIG